MSTHQQIAPPPKPLKWYKALGSFKGRSEAGAFLVEGEKAVRQIAEFHPKEILEIVAPAGREIVFPHLPLRKMSSKQISAVSHSRTPQGVMAVVLLPQDTYKDEIPSAAGERILLLEDIQDPGNVGTLIRTASAFDYSGVILSEKCADPFSPKAVQSSAGSLLSLWIRRSVSYLELAQGLLDKGYTLLVADLRGTAPPSAMSRYKNTVLALGNEASGAGEGLLHLARQCVKIPLKSEKAESLNVAACGAILMYLSTLEK